MMDVICWLWKQNILDDNQLYTPHDVNRLYKGLKKYLSIPFRITCITDTMYQNIHPQVVQYPLWKDFDQEGGCWRRLKLFDHPDFQRRWVWIDLDSVIVNQLDPLFERQENIVLWESKTSRALYNGSMVMYDPPSVANIWRSFDYDWFVNQNLKFKFYGTDQSWLSYYFGHAAPIWTPDDGVYDYKRHRCDIALPENARIVFFCGRPNPPSLIEKHEWVADYFKL